DVVRIINDLDCRGLIVRPRPDPTVIFLEQNVGPVSAGAFGYRELGVREHGDSRPLREVTIQDNRIGSADDSVELLGGFDVIGRYRNTQAGQAEGEHRHNSRYFTSLSTHMGAGFRQTLQLGPTKKHTDRDLRTSNAETAFFVTDFFNLVTSFRRK